MDKEHRHGYALGMKKSQHRNRDRRHLLQARADARAWGWSVIETGPIHPTAFTGLSPGPVYRATSKQEGTALPPRVIAWQFNVEQGYCLEFGEQYVRFFFQGAPVIVAGVPYEIVSPYTAADLPQLKFVQSADVMTITHPSYPPYDLARHAATTWTLTPLYINEFEFRHNHRDDPDAFGDIIARC